MTNQTKRTRTLAKRPSQGFALVVTLSLMILLTIIAVGLLTLSTVTLRTSNKEADLIIARSNARLGMMMALNQLQSALGPDQRVTAPADLKLPSAASPKWIGVYGNEEDADYSQKPSAIPSQPYKPTLLNWLVSGNESVSFASSKVSGSFGKITSPPTSVPYSPGDAVNLTGSPTVKNQRAALLVSTGSANSASGTDASVAAPITTLRDSSGNTKGGYAYWVADEGMKARIDLRDNYRQQTTASEINASKAYSFVTSQRSGIEMMRKDFTKDSSIGSDYDPASPNLEKLATTGQLALLSSTFQSGGILKNRFHDVTAYSKSVIADSYAGGLRQDMSSVIYGNAGPAASTPIFTPESNGETGLPTWGHLKSWANLTAPLSIPPPTASSSSVRPYTPTQSRFGPVLSMASFGFGLEPVPGSPNQMRVQIYPALILWNPYTVGIPAANYEVGFGFRPASGGNDTITVQTGAGTNGPWTTAGSFNLSGGDSGMNAGNGFFRFQVKGEVIPAGQSHIYLAEYSGTAGPYVPGASALVRAPSTAPIGYNTRYFTTTRTITFTGSDPYLNFLSNFGANGTMASGDRREVVLTEPNGLAGGFSDSTPVYQALMDMNIYRRFFPTPNADPKRLSTIRLQPPFVFRNQIMMEARGGFSADWRKVGAMRSTSGVRGQERNRWIANHNPIAPYIKRTRNETSLLYGAFSHGSIVSGDVGEANSMMMGVSNVSNYLAGIGGDQSPGTDGPLIDILPTSSMLLSLGQLQHAQFDAYGFGTTYTFGNAGAHVAIPRAQQFVNQYIARPGASPTNYQDPLYDVSWHANRALWDRYFVSTASSSLTQSDIDNGEPLPNARMVYHSREGTGPDVGNLRPGNTALTEAAANLMVSGGFNINSTSVDAWRALLTGTNQLTLPSELANPMYGSTPTNAMMPRFSRDVRTSSSSNYHGILNMWGTSGSDQRYNVYRGNRELLLFRELGKGSESATAAQQRLHSVAGELAEKIVEEIRLRGPFLSIGDFVNRKLVAGNEGIRGTLQAAIDKMANNKVNPEASFNQIGAFLNDDRVNFTIPGWDVEHFMGTPLSEAGSASNARTANAPKHLTQADVLTTIGPAISARSDTFVIRSYGESLNPGSTIPSARAWCEAVVQRTPDYIASGDKASTPPQNLTKDLNKTLGRRFEIVSFRWLSEQEL